MSYRIKLLLTQNNGDWRRRSAIIFQPNSTLSFHEFTKQCAQKLYPNHSITNSTPIKLYDITNSETGLIQIDDDKTTLLCDLYEDNEIYRNCQILIILPLIHQSGIINPSNEQKMELKKEQQLFASYSSEEEQPTKEVDIKPKLPVHHEWLWKHTQLRSPKKTTLSIADIKQLLITRGEKENDLKNLNNSKKKLIKRLLRKHTVWLLTPIKQLTHEQLRVELALHDITNSSCRIKQMVNKYIDSMLQKFPPPGWKYLDHRLPSVYFTDPLMLNQNEIFIAITNTPAMYKYNICDGGWREWINYGSYIKSINITAICISLNDKMIYIRDNKYNLIKIHYKNSAFSVEIVETAEYMPDQNAEGMDLEVYTRQLICVNHELHMMRSGGYTYEGGGGAFTMYKLEHLIFNEKSKRFEVKHTINWGVRKCLKFEHLKSRNKLICVGSNDFKIEIYSFDLYERQWKYCEIVWVCNEDRRSSYFYDAGCAVTRDQNRIVLYRNGGSNLFIIDMIDNDKKLKFKLMKSKIKFPTAGDGRIFQKTTIMRNLEKEECIVFGYVRKIWRKYNIGMERFPPQYILRLIQSWYWNDYYDDMHILKCFEDESLHCTINVRDIVENVYIS